MNEQNTITTGVQGGAMPSSAPTQQPDFRLPGISDLFARAWDHLEKNIVKFLQIIGIQIVIAIASLLIAFFIGESVISKTENIGLQLLVLGGSIALAFIVIALSTVWSMLATIHTIDAGAQGRTLNLLDVYKNSRSRILGYAGTFILMNLAVMGGNFLLFIPGLILFVWFSVAIYITALQGESGARALMKSREYVRGYEFSVLGRMFVGVLIFIVLYALIQFIVQGAIAQGALTNALTMFIVGIIQNLFGVLFIAYGYEIYSALKQRISTQEIPAPSSFNYFIIYGSAFLGIVLPIIVMFVGISVVRMFAGV